MVPAHQERVGDRRDGRRGPARRRGARGRPDRGDRPRPPRRGRADDRRRGPRGRARLHRRALALRPLLLRLSVRGIEGAPGRDHGSRRHVLVLAGAAASRPGRGRARMGGRHRRLARPGVGDVRAVPRRARRHPSRGQRRAPGGPRGAPHRRDGLRESPRRHGRPQGDGAAARRGDGRRRVRLLHRSRVRAQRLLEHRGADHARARDARGQRALLLAHPRGVLDAARLHRGSDPHRRRGRRRRPGLAREGLGQGELAEDRRGAAHDRGRQGARRGRARRRLPLQRRQHQARQPHADVGARRRHREAPGAARGSRHAPEDHRRVPDRRRAVGHGVAGRRRLRPDLHRLLQAARGRGPQPRAARATDGTAARRVR